MKRRPRRSKQIKYVDSRDFAGFMRKILEMMRIERGLIENDMSGDQILGAELLVT